VDFQVITGSESLGPWVGKADRLLIDAPCSGTGTFRRNPDRKWKFLPEELQEVQETQQKILKDYSKLVKPGGVLVYSTCSILPSENNLQIEAFLSRNPNWLLVEEKHIFPDQTEGDGFYMARLKSL
jgi:16S rRNA (cytosine967-C5)-methyltransferase